MSPAIMPTYARSELVFDHGQGAFLVTAEGRRFLDFTAGIAVCALGHAHPHLVEALNRQASKLWHCSNLHRIPEGERLAERLCAHSFAEKVFFCNSGVEAIECGIKVVRKYHDETGNPHRYRIIACHGAFHGRTITALSAAGHQKHLEGFLPTVAGFDHVAFENMNELRAAITDETAAILVEPIQGEGGIRPASLDYLRALREVCDEFGLLLFYDEIQCGMGRTGKLFSHQWTDGAEPDVMAVAKGLGGGFPVGACLTSERAAIGMVAGTHGSTFGGNPLAMAVANAVLDVMLEDGFLENVVAMGDRLRAGCRSLVEAHPTILAEVRGGGLMLGLRCLVSNGELAGRLKDAGLLVVPAADNVIRLLPPLTITVDEVDQALAILGRVCADWGEAGT